MSTARWRKIGRRLGASVALGLLCAGIASAAPAVEALDAAKFRTVLAEHRGEVVLVNFWATWCRPCLKEIPALMALAQDYADRDFALVAVSLDEPDSLEPVVRPFLDKWFPGFSTYLRAEPELFTLVGALDPAWNEILPTSYLLDREGRVVRRIQGGKSGAEFAAAIEPLLQSK